MRHQMLFRHLDERERQRIPNAHQPPKMALGADLLTRCDKRFRYESTKRNLDVEVLDVQRIIFNELAARLDVLAH